MLEFIGVATAIVGVYIAYLTLQHQRGSSRELAKTSTQPPAPTHDAETIRGNEACPVPDGIIFANRVVLVPGFQVRLFTHSGRIEEDILRGRQYSWLQRGEVIGRYHMEVPNSNADYFRHLMGTKDLSVEVRSPVSGLILHSRFSQFVQWPAPGDALAAKGIQPALSILIADDEPAPESNAYLYGPALRFIHNHKGPLFRPSRYWSMQAMNEVEFDRLVQFQQEAECLIVDALPEFREYLDEARTRFPSLRPYIKHLR